mmetsp:Transcript_99914/g.287120  ORF Transcript_99914/g.287120 Transcript_99914/m.287120 type:complete len:288 (-) Transcript_99914:59-922(-)
MDGFSDSQRAVMRLATVAVAAGALMWLLNWSQRRPLLLGATTLVEEREALKPLQAELCRRFFAVCMEVAGVAKTVRSKIREQNVDITDDKLREQLSRQCQVYGKLRDMYAEIAKRAGVSLDELQELQRRHSADPEVHAYTEGVQKMLDTALGGVMPVLPNVQIPPALTEDKVLEILAEVHDLETQTVLKRLKGQKISVKDLGEALTAAYKEAWETTLEAHQSEIVGGNEVYHSSLALYMQREGFAEKRKALDDKHQQRMLELFQPDHHKYPSAQSPGNGAKLGSTSK